MTDDERATIARLAESAREDPATVDVDEIAAWLEGPDDPPRERAATALHAVSMEHAHRVTDAVPRLVALLESDRATLRSKALATLANVGTLRPDLLVPHVEAIAASLDDESSTVHRSAAHALETVASVEPSAVAPTVSGLVPLLDSDVESARSHAASALAHVADEEPEAVFPAVGSLLDVVEDDFQQPSGLTYDPSMSSGMSDPSDQMRGLRMLTNDPEGRSSNAAARETTAATIAILAEDDAVRAATALDDDLPRLFELLDDRNPFVRKAAAEALAAVAEAEPDAVRPAESDLIGALDGPTPVGRHAVRALESIGTERTLTALRDLAHDDTVDGELRAAAERALDAGDR